MAKRKVKNKIPSKVWKKYSISTNKLERKKSCPRCGQGTFLAEHQNRTTCGKCGFTEFFTKEHKK